MRQLSVSSYQSAVGGRQSAVGSIWKTLPVVLFLLLTAYCSLLTVDAQEN